VPSSSRKIPENDSVVQSLFAEILEHIKSDEDPDVLNAYRSLVRKNVPFFMRTYFAGYLFKQLHEYAPSDGRRSSKKDQRRGERSRGDRSEEGGRGKPARQSSLRDGALKEGGPKEGGPKEGAPKEPSSRESGPRHGEKTARTQPQPPREERKVEPRREPLPEDVASTLFFSVGRNRRAYAKELLGLIETIAEVSRDNVGDLRVLDNFSFVQVKKEVADTIISALDGHDYKGRSLSVGYAKPRKDPNQVEKETDAPDRESDSSGKAENQYAEPSEAVGQERTEPSVEMTPQSDEPQVEQAVSAEGQAATEDSPSDSEEAAPITEDEESR